MGDKKIQVLNSLVIITIFCLVVSCATGGQATNERGEDQQRGGTFDPSRISQQHYNTTREEVQRFIEELNLIIRNRDFNAWKGSLSPEYFLEISSPENLRRVSDLPAMRTRRIVLRTAEDFFQHVVVPSRADLRVDDIEFISMNRVKAFTITTNRAGEEVRLRLYDLEKIGNTWTIIN
jgi:hypothetical protein